MASFVYKYAEVYCLYLIGSQPNLLLLFFPPGDDFVGDKVLNVLSRHTRRFALGDSFCIIFISLSPPRWRACACHQPRVASRTWSWSIAGYKKKQKEEENAATGHPFWRAFPIIIVGQLFSQSAVAKQYKRFVKKRRKKRQTCAHDHDHAQALQLSSCVNTTFECCFLVS